MPIREKPEILQNNNIKWGDQYLDLKIVGIQGTRRVLRFLLECIKNVEYSLSRDISVPDYLGRLNGTGPDLYLWGLRGNLCIDRNF